ncbi:MAG: hypothetical protein P1R74_05945 [Sedimenticola sp.]|uniref:Uncharacterized protein n=1 Tax=Sedimenticola thiotaurini TaxID=1543721 RepID=A0A558CMX8_9GAMM|nr:hypothetical protein [Sedimenticola sp.]TVT50129.1 MAG: hypothetical protein FHK82_16570 [Sedimenticola thiotaurini]
MDFLKFNHAQYKEAFNAAVADLSLSLKLDESAAATHARERIGAMQGYIDLMQRLDSDREADGVSLTGATDASQIGGMILQLLDDIGQVAVNRGLIKTMQQMQRFSLPTALWIAQHEGKIEKLDIVVNAIASFANEGRSQEQLEVLCDVIKQVQSAVSEKIRRDVELNDPMRPWRILNLNWGIVATRTLSPPLMASVFDQLIDAIPIDAKAFFQEGMEQMDIVGYPESVREVMVHYSNLLGADSSLH